MRFWCSKQIDSDKLCDALNELEKKGYKIKEIIPISYHNNTQYSYSSVYRYEVVYTIEDSTEE